MPNLQISTPAPGLGTRKAYEPPSLVALGDLASLVNYSVSIQVK